jgi:hypothetical protein
MRMLILLCLGTVLVSTETASAQPASTGTEASQRRIQCKVMAEQKAEEIRDLDASLGKNAPQIRKARQSSHYDLNNSRCYIELYRHELVRGRMIERETRALYDAQIDEMLAYTQIENGKKSGVVFDLPNQTKNAGWDDADN